MNSFNTIKPRKEVSHFLNLSMLILLSACAQNADRHDTVGKFSLPQALQRTTLPFQGLKAYVKVDQENRRSMSIDASTSKAHLEISGLKTGMHTFTIEYEYTSQSIVNPVSLVIAVITHNVKEGKNTLSLIEDDYDYIDSDNDGFSNLLELEADTDPTNPNSKPPPVFTLSGTVTLGGINPLAGVNFSLEGPIAASTISDNDGHYRFDRLPNGVYIVTANSAGYTFNPLNMRVVIDDRHASERNFTALAVGTTYTISGNVAVGGSGVLPNASVSLAGNSSGFTATDVAGNYAFAGLPNGTYQVRVAAEGYILNPIVRTTTITNANQYNQNFTANASPPAPRYSISGMITYGGNQAGKIHLRAQRQFSGEGYIGTVVSGPGSYTIRGVEPGNYEVLAFMDHRGTGIRHAANPNGISDLFPINADTSGVNIIISSDITLPAVSVPQAQNAYPMDGMALVFWNIIENSQGQETADEYNIYWSQSGIPTPVAHDGTATQIARGEGFYFHHGLSNGDNYTYVVTAVVNGIESNPSGPIGPITIGPQSGGFTVSGTVSFNHNTESGSFHVGLYNDGFSTFIGTHINSPTNPQSYSLSGIPDGQYNLFAFLDENGDGHVDSGDFFVSEGLGIITINGNGLNNIDLYLDQGRSITSLKTNHSLSTATTERYGIAFEFKSGTDFPVAATIVDGTNLSVPIDLVHEWRRNAIEFRTDFAEIRPVVNSAYTVELIYRDNSTELVSVSVTDVLDNFAQPVAPTGTITDLTPLFSWSSPLSPPSIYFYSIGVRNSDGAQYWKSGLLPQTQLSIEYNANGEAQNLAPDTYLWSLNLRDEFQNEAGIFSQFNIQ